MKADFQRLRQTLADAQLTESVERAHDIDEAWGRWSDLVMDAVNECVPRAKLKNTKSRPWIEREARHLHNQKRSSWRKAKKLDKPDDWARFRKLRNDLQSLFSKKYNSYLHSLSGLVKSNSKGLCLFFRTKTKSSSMPNCVKHHDTVVTDPADMASKFNDYFF